MLDPRSFDSVAPSMKVIVDAFEQSTDKKNWVAQAENRKLILHALTTLGGKIGAFSHMNMNMAMSLVKGVFLCAILATHLEDSRKLYDFVLEVISVEQEAIGVPILRPDEQRILETFYGALGVLRDAKLASDPQESYVEPAYLRDGPTQLAERIHEAAREISSKTHHLWPEEGTAWSESSAKWKTLLMGVGKKILETSSILHQGMHARRLKSNSEEKRFALAWARENAFQDLTSLMLGLDGDSRSVAKASAHDAKIVATTIQWLGTNVGRGFLYELGYRKQE